MPFDWYLALIIAGTRQHGFATERFAGQAFTIDERVTRPTRQEALDALEAIGIRNYRRVLP